MSGKKNGLRFQPTGGAKRSALPVGQKCELRIERLAHDGRGIAHADGRTWFIQGALVEEVVSARVLAARSKTVDACCERVLVASPLRQSPLCPYAGVCGGCTLQHMAHEQQLALKQKTLAEHLEKIAGLSPERWAEPLQGSPFGYRRRARLAVRWNAGSRRLDIGFRALASQKIVNIERCPVLVDSLSALLQPLANVLQTFNRPQRIGHVELSHGGCEALLLRHVGGLDKQDLAALQSFCNAHGVRLWLQGDGVPEPCGHHEEMSCLLDEGNIIMHYRPGDFIQINEIINRKMIQQAIDWLSPVASLHVLDLFCGIGNFSLPLARRAASVTGIEGDEAMVSRAAANAAWNGLTNARFEQADLAEPVYGGMAWARQRFDAVLLDPPREGARDAVRGMADQRPSRILYVSCDPATLARDAALLKQQGYRLRRAGILDMFPQTAHVESMALFET